MFELEIFGKLLCYRLNYGAGLNSETVDLQLVVR